MANMHLVTGYAGKTHITAADHGSLNAALFGSGSYVLDRGSKFAATVVTNNTIKIADGDIIIQGRHARLNEGSTAELTIENGAHGVLRNDLIVVRYARDSASGVEEANLAVIKGAGVAANPADPAYNTGNLLNGDAATVDVPLYRVVLNGLNVQKLVALFTAVGVGGDGATAVYTHSKSGGTHNFTGAGSNGKALIKSAFAAGDKIAVNGKIVPAFCGADEVDELPVGRWVYFAFDGEQVNFKGGGGISNAKVSTTTAGAAHVLKGKTFYSGNKVLKTGTLPEFANQNIKANGIYGGKTGDYLNFYIARGGYTFDGIVYIYMPKADVAEAIGLTSANLAVGHTVLNLPGTATTLAMEVSGTTLVGATTLKTATLPAGTYKVNGCSARDSSSGSGQCGLLAVYVDGAKKVTGTNTSGGFGCSISGTFTLAASASVSIRQEAGNNGDASNVRAVTITRTA